MRATAPDGRHHHGHVRTKRSVSARVVRWAFLLLVLPVAGCQQKWEPTILVTGTGKGIETSLVDPGYHACRFTGEALSDHGALLSRSSCSRSNKPLDKERTPQWCTIEEF